MCAEMAADLEPCKSLLWYAAYAQDHIKEEADLLSCHVKAHLSEVGHDTARVSTQVFGGMGFTDLLGMHYWFKRIGLSRQMLGGPEKVRQEAAILQGFLS
jgi:alkylation response protein AidB-like acyl-CoA dehydrogenase